MDYENYAMSAAETIFALRERVKELSCLYNITELINRDDLSFDSFIAEVLEIIPRSMQYPSATACRIQIDTAIYETADLQESEESIATPIVVNKRERGHIRLFYLESANVQFLPEEEQLLKGIARQLASVLERREREESNQKIEEQLRYADRLATIGQLVAGIANEIDDPLSIVLDYLNKLAKDQMLSTESHLSLQNVVNSAMHAKEIVRKLMIFSRQVAPNKSRVNINQLIKEGFYVLESRCKSLGINLVYDLREDLPETIADASQIHQALVNLIVNAMQAMPEGGTLHIATNRQDDHITILVKDTGIGMDEEIKQRIFVPFYTTKNEQQGTGLGLPVVHGIITAHNGSILVESEPGFGTSFTISLKVADYDLS